MADPTTAGLVNDLDNLTLKDNVMSIEQSARNILLSSKKDDISNILSSKPSGLLITGGDRKTRRAIVELVSSSVLIVSACQIVLDTATIPTRETCLGYETVCIDDVDFPDEKVESQIKALFSNVGLTHTIIGLATTDASVPTSLRRAGRFDVVYRINAPSLQTRERAWQRLLECIESEYSIAQPLEGFKELAVHSPGYGISDFTNAVCTFLYEVTTQLEKDQKIIDYFGILLNAVSSHQPMNSSVDLPFVTAGGYSPSESEDGWSSHGGYKFVKTTLTRLAEWPLRYSATFSRMGVRPPHGILLHGPAGCGKTLLAQCFVRRLRHANWLQLSADALFCKYLGESEQRVRKVFARARELAPCVVLLDDIDGIGRGRIQDADGGGSGVEGRVLATLLTELDGLQGGDIFIVACARELTLLDAALLRPGRLDEHIEIGLPNFEDRVAIARVALDGVPIENGSLGWGRAVDLVARHSDGFCGAEIVGMCREVCMVALENSSEVSYVPEELFTQVCSAT